MPINLAELRTRAQQRADMVGSNFVSNTEWAYYLNEGLAELHEMIVGKHEDFLVTSTTITLAANTQEYALPNDFLAIRGVDVVSGNTHYTLRPFMFRERNRYETLAGCVTSIAGYMYQVVGGKLRIVPTPAGSGETLTLWYVPQVDKLVGDLDTINVAYADGWERYIVLYAAIKALQKEESDVSTHMAELDALQKRIEANSNRTSADAKRVVDVRYVTEGWL